MDPGYSYSNAGSRREWVCGYFTLRQDLQIFPEFCEYFWNCANITQTIPPNIAKHFHNFPEISRMFQNTSRVVPISGELFCSIFQNISANFQNIPEYFWNCANIRQTILPNIAKQFHNFPEISRIFQNTVRIVPISGKLFR